MSATQQSQGFAYPTTGYVQPTTTESSVTAATPAGTQQTAQTGTSTSAQTQTRQAAEEARKDRTLAEFMLMLDDYEPLVCETFICHIVEHN